MQGRRQGPRTVDAQRSQFGKLHTFLEFRGIGGVGTGGHGGAEMCSSPLLKTRGTYIEPFHVKPLAPDTWRCFT